MGNSIIFISFSALTCLVSFFLDKEKTISGVKKGFKMLKNIVIPFLNILILVSLLIYFVPPEMINKYLGAGSGAMGFALAAVIGSVTLIPGFISYPLSAGLLAQGASYSTIAVFMTSLMMVGVVTMPLEIKYFGRKVAIMRNSLNLLAAIIIGILIGFIL